MLVRANQEYSELLLEISPYFKKGEMYDLKLVEDAPKEIKIKFEEFLKMKKQ